MRREPRDQLDLLVKLELRALLVLQELQEVPDLRVLLALLDLRVLQGRQDPLDRLVPPVNLDLRVQLVKLERQVRADSPAVLEQLERLESQVLVVHKVLAASKVNLVILVNLDP